MKTLIHRIIAKQNFFPGPLALLINPFYFARKGLYQNVNILSHFITGKILDAGCGQKPYRSLFRYNQYIGMDIEQSGHNHANENIDVFYDGHTFPFENETFDSVLSNEVLEHVFNPGEHLSEIHRVLRPNGFLLLTVPFLWDEHEQPYDYARYSSFGLKYLLENHGFEIVIHKKSMADVRAIFQLFNAYIFKKTQKWRKRYLGLFLTLVLNAPINIIGSLLGFLLPSNPDLYLDNIVLARKRGKIAHD